MHKISIRNQPASTVVIVNSVEKNLKRILFLDSRAVRIEHLQNCHRLVAAQYIHVCSLCFRVTMF